MNKKIFIPLISIGLLLAGCNNSNNDTDDTPTDTSTHYSKEALKAKVTSDYVLDGFEALVADDDDDDDWDDEDLDESYHISVSTNVKREGTTSTGWTSDQIALLNTYSGEALPYPSTLITGDVSVNEITADDYSYLEITNVADSFTLETYHTLLSDAGWNIITDYKGNKVQTDVDGIKFVEATKAATDNSVGYDIIYFYQEEYTDSDGEVIPGANVIRCYNDLDATKTSNTAWSDDEIATMNYVLTTTVPFMQLGNRNVVSSQNDSYLLIRDAYCFDLTSAYVDLLKTDGFTLNSEASTYYNQYFLTKTLTDRSEIYVTLYYMGGNYINCYYEPNVVNYSSWPTALMEEVKTTTGVTVPSFEIADGGSYYAYKKNNGYYVYTYNLKDGYDYEEYAYNQLQYIGLTWEETISFGTQDLLDDDYNVVGFAVIISVLTPTSTFVDTYPNDKVNEVVTNLLEISDVTVPEFTDFELPVSDKKVKYEIYGNEYYQVAYGYYYSDIKDFPSWYGLDDDASDEEIAALADSLAKQELGIKVSIYDVDFAAYEAYELILKNACWYLDYDEYGNTVYEDPTGTVAVTLTGNAYSSHNDEGTTTFLIHKGSGEYHEEVFEFEEKEISMAAGQQTDLILNVKMLPYEVTYTSSDATGNISVDNNGCVTVKEGTPVNSVAKITASIQVPGEDAPRTTSCYITVIDALYYTPKSAIDAIAQLMRNDGFNPVVNYYTGDMSQIDQIILNLGPTASPSETDPVSTVTWKDGTIYEGENEYEGQFIDYQIYNEYCYITVTYAVYEVNGNLVLQVTAL